MSGEVYIKLLRQVCKLIRSYSKTTHHFLLPRIPNEAF